VTFKSQFSASQEKAHNRNIATKIHEELSKLRAGVDASPTTPKRWVWELIQNAKDVNIDGKVRVRIEAGLDDADAHVTFRHNGGAFSAENIRFLIEQVSSKDRTNDSTGRPTTTGRFGTGFLTTHLLSDRVVIKGCHGRPRLRGAEVQAVARSQRFGAGRHHHGGTSRERLAPGSR
jgi:hypothetical protein